MDTASLETQVNLPAKTHIAFIGAGNMASSIAGGLIKHNHPADAITLCDPSESSRAKAAERLPGINITTENHKAFAEADVIVLAVKPQIMEAVCRDLSGGVSTPGTPKDAKLIISIAAGVTIQQIETWLISGKPNRSEIAIIRCMPNTPALINEGMTGYFANPQVTEEQKQIATAILMAVGDVVEVAHEDEINTITAVSGSGPAYYFYLMEAMINAGEALGLSRETATRLTLKTAVGAAQLAASPDSPEPATLRAQVTSPGGTTERALETFNAGKVDKTVIDAIKAAHDRAVELARE